MLDVFTPMPRAVRGERRAAYHEFLRERDGVPNFGSGTLPRREARMLRFSKPLSRVREIDRDLFARQYRSFDPRLDTSNELLLLLSMVKVNAAEHYGVKRTVDAVRRQAIARGDDLELTILLEEEYHTRILLSAAQLYGLSVRAPYEPPAALRAFICAIAKSPECLAYPLALSGEIVGTLLFTNLLQWVHENLGYDPELRDAIEERIVDVLVDEIGHISYNRTLMGTEGLALTRTVLPFAMGGLSAVAPELRRLGVLPTRPGRSITTLFSSGRLPESVRRQAFIA